jgi:hypothetical protein
MEEQSYGKNIFIMLTTTGVDSFRENETFDRNFQGIPMFCAGKMPKTLEGTREMVLGSIVDTDPIERVFFAGSRSACRAEFILFNLKTTIDNSCRINGPEAHYDI